jgi:fermentation-respiration switch protein FrsA (DUF1100 family)
LPKPKRGLKINAETQRSLRNAKKTALFFLGVLCVSPVLASNRISRDYSIGFARSARKELVQRFGWLGKLTTPLLTCQLRPRLGIGLADLQPIRHAGKISSPKFFIAGTTDHDTTLPESEALFAAAAEPKQFWPVAGAAHVDMHNFAKTEYERRILTFLAAHLN